ncbi:AbiH family protein [Flavobacterium sp.]|uniref:AbiH family protein n=1 Tax=Flavobacterium sp. TaxID=239 RepID=UPI004034D5C3
MTDYSTMMNFVEQYSESYDPMFADQFNRCKIGYSNSFFNSVCSKKVVQNWVDIENEYYKLLKDCLKEEDNSKVRKLNEEFEQVKNLLEQYLKDNIAERYDFQIPNENYKEILRIFSVEPLYLSRNPDHIYFKEFSEEDYKDLITFDNKLADSWYNRTLQQDFNSGEINQRNLILNFNYTPVIDKYISEARNGTHLHRNIAFGETWQIQIHGKLFDVANSINFGFGDEMDEGYNLLEKKDDNEYLRNIKSFQYLQNSNYKDMLDFIESDKFQVYIMGHSCGLSDRILLNTIFEHNNCRSIKVFYHERNGKDNYTDIVQNISRHFNKKKMMRDKIVNKSLCQPLPQGVRFDEKGSYKSNMFKNFGTYPK